MSQLTTFDGGTGARMDKAFARWMRQSARVPGMISFKPSPRTIQLIKRFDKIMEIGERLACAENNL